MTVTSLVEHRLRLDITISRRVRVINEPDDKVHENFFYQKPVFVGPFLSPQSAIEWEQRFVQVAAIDWEFRSKRLRGHESREAYGRTVFELAESSTVSSASAASSRGNPEVGVVVSIRADHAIDHGTKRRGPLGGLAYDIDPSTTPPEEFGDNVKDYMREFCQEVLRKL